MIEASEALAAIGVLPDVEIDPALAAMQLARLDAPKADWRAASEHLSMLAHDSVRLGTVMSGRSQEARIGALAGLLHAHHGYDGDHETYDDLDNGNLIRVIERRRGLPVSLGILWLHCIRAAGWEGHGIDFPGHFLLSLLSQGGGGGAAAPERQPRRMLIDPFDRGASIGSARLLSLLRRMGGDSALEPGMTRPMSTRAVLLRLQRNLLQRRLAAGALPEALGTLEGMLLVAPDVMAHWLDAADLNRAMGRRAAALRCLEHVLDVAPRSEAAALARARLQTWTGDV